MQMPTFSSPKTLATLLCSLAIVACGPPDEASRTKSGPIVGPFVVSDFFTPSGLMGDGAKPGRVVEDIDVNCKQPRPAGAQGDCYHFLWHVEEDAPVPLDDHWAGAYWVYPSNSWGTVPGRDVVGPVDKGPNPAGGAELRGYNHVRFSIAVDPGLMTPPFIQYFVGGIDGRKAVPPQPYFDNGCYLFPGTPPMCVDTSAQIPNTPYPLYQTDGVNATPVWQQVVMPLDKWSMTSLIGAFGFSTNDTGNMGLPQSIYIDDIVWE